MGSTRLVGTKDAFDQSGERARRRPHSSGATWPQTPPSSESLNFDQPLVELLDTIDFAAIADHWLARFSGYRIFAPSAISRVRRTLAPVCQKQVVFSESEKTVPRANKKGLPALVGNGTPLRSQ